MKLICDVMLGKLARYLRLLGFDTLYARNATERERLRARHPDRLLITRARRTAGPGVIPVTSEITREQLRELKNLLQPEITRGMPMSRCIECNRELLQVDKQEIECLVPEFVFHHYADFSRCPACGKVYWQGSHTQGMKDLLQELLA
jgi:uncharacterized protein with PIN domain